MIRDAGSKFHDYSVSPKTRQILLHWGYELTEKDFYWIDKFTNKKKALKRLRKILWMRNEKWESKRKMRNEKWEWKQEMRI